MRAVRATNTKPELIVRPIAHAMGFRYRLHRRDLPGTPDIVFGPRRAAVFVHGCFWHRHDCARGRRTPRANADFWEAKLTANAVRDARTAAALAHAGWTVLTIWECETRDRADVAARLRALLER